MKNKVCFNILLIKVTVFDNTLVGLIIILSQEHKQVQKFDSKKFEFTGFCCNLDSLN